MSFGLQQTNPSGVVAIDQDYSNYTLHSTVTINNIGDSYFLYVYVPDVEGVLAFSDSRVNISQWDCLAKRGSTQAFFSDLGTFHIYFYVPSAAYISNVSYGYGLNVYKADGGVAFSSNLRYSKHKATYTLNTDTAYASLPYPSNTVAPIFCLSPFVTQGSYDYAFEGGMAAVGDSQFRGRIAGSAGAYTLEVGSDGIYNMNQINMSGYGFGIFVWQDNAHIYLGDF